MATLHIPTPLDICRLVCGIKEPPFCEDLQLGMSSSFDKVVSSFLNSMTSFEEFTASINSAILKHFPLLAKPVCPFHDICFCDECCELYKNDKFTYFLNSCEHECAQCLDAAVSVKRISQLELLLQYAQHLERTDEEALMKESLAEEI